MPEMRRSADGHVQCPNCGSETYSSAQMAKNKDTGGTDVFLICKNCSHPMFVLNESDPTLTSELAAFFTKPPEGE